MKKALYKSGKIIIIIIIVIIIIIITIKTTRSLQPVTVILHFQTIIANSVDAIQHTHVSTTTQHISGLCNFDLLCQEVFSVHLKPFYLDDILS